MDVQSRNGLLFVIVTTENSLGAYLRMRAGERERGGQKEEEQRWIEYYYSVPSPCTEMAKKECKFC